MPRILRAAAVAGAATAASNKVAHKQDEKWAAEEAAKNAQQEPTTDSHGSDKITMLKDLAGLRDAGVLTEEEFASEKAKILNS
ncbi:MAG: SHOCT domain-containing protein [Candidatus Nanopelagicales bacterium]|jgi:hypothetical protein